MSAARNTVRPCSRPERYLAPGLTGRGATVKPLTGRGLGPKLPAALAPARHRRGACVVDGCLAAPAAGVAGSPSRALLRTWSCLVAPRNEFSRTITVEPWPERGIAVDWSADPVERRALAQRFDLIDVASLRGYGRLARNGDELHFEGRLEAEVVQACVASLEPVAATIAVPVIRRYQRVEGVAVIEDHADIDLDDEEAIEPLRGREIDLGEALAEQLGLALDPYPRAAKADDLIAPHLGGHVDSEPTEMPQRSVESPFAALRQLHAKRADR